MDFNNDSHNYNYSWLVWCSCGDLSWWDCFLVVGTCMVVGLNKIKPNQPWIVKVMTIIIKIHMTSYYSMSKPLLEILLHEYVYHPATVKGRGRGRGVEPGVVQLKLHLTLNDRQIFMNFSYDMYFCILQQPLLFNARILLGFWTTFLCVIEWIKQRIVYLIVDQNFILLHQAFTWPDLRFYRGEC